MSKKSKRKLKYPENPTDVLIMSKPITVNGRCEHDQTYQLGINQKLGHLYLNCYACGTTVSRPLQWCSPYPEDYIIGDPDNAWGAYDWSKQPITVSFHLEE